MEETMQTNVETTRPMQDRDTNEDQYRRPSCGQPETVQPEAQKLGPNTVQLLHLLDEMGI